MNWAATWAEGWSALGALTLALILRVAIWLGDRHG